MGTKIGLRQSDVAVEELIALFDHARHPREVELIADSLGKSGDARAIRPLLMHLGDGCVREDADLEDALCVLVVAIGAAESRATDNRTGRSRGPALRGR